MNKRSMESFIFYTGEYNVSFSKKQNFVRIESIEKSDGALCWDPSHDSSLVPSLSEASEIFLKCNGTERTASILCENEIGTFCFSVQVDERFPGAVKTWSDVIFKKQIEKGEFCLNKEGEFVYLDKKPELIDYFRKPTGFPVIRPSWRSDLNQFVFFGDNDILKGTMLYYADFTDMNSYFSQSGTTMFYDLESDTHVDIVQRNPENPKDCDCIRFGVKVQDNVLPISQGEKVRFSSSVLVCIPDVPSLEQDEETASVFLKAYNVLFAQIKKPERTYYNWEKASQKMLQEVYERKGQDKGIYHYGGDLNFNMRSFLEFFRIFMPERVEMQMEENVRRIWEQDRPDYVNDVGHKGLFGWYKNREDAAYADFWQGYTWPLCMALEFSLDFHDKKMQEAMLRNAEVLIDTARELDYTFTVFVDINQGKRVETGYDFDYGNAGSYVYAMILYYELTGEERFLDEAKKAAKKLAGFGFAASGFELNVTVQSVYGLLKLYSITKDETYIAQSCIQLATILKHTWLFSPTYGKFKDRTIFMLTSARANLDYANSAEEAVMLRYFYKILTEYKGVLPDFAENLIAECISWKMVGGGDCIPAFHKHKEVIHTGKPSVWDEINKEGYIALEPSGYTSDKALLGSICECVYGMGMNLELCMRQIQLLDDKKLYAEAPLYVTRSGPSLWSVELAGLQRKAIIGLSEGMEIKDCNGAVPTCLGVYSDDGWQSYEIAPGMKYRIST